MRRGLSVDKKEEMNDLYRSHIVILTGHHMVATPRVWKEANALVNSEYRVSVLTTFSSIENWKLDKQLLNPSVELKPLVNLITGQGSFREAVLSRLRKKIAILIKRIFGFEDGWLIAYAPKTQLKRALAENGDLYIAHEETGLLIGNELLKKGKKVAFDFEDWYSEDYLSSDRPVKFLKKLEKQALTLGAYCTCTSMAMRNALTRSFNIEREIEVIYNGFSISENTFLVNGEIPNSIVWFSQTIGPGRGIEKLISVLHQLHTSVQLHLIGDISAGYSAFLESNFPAGRHTLHIHPAVKHSLLISLLSRYSVGLAIENSSPQNKDVTVSNKILQYIQAGLKVFATDTEGQIEVGASFPRLVTLVSAEETEGWANALGLLLACKAEDVKNEHRVFKELYSWEAQETKLLKLVNASISE